MGRKLFGVDVAKIIKQEVGDKMLSDTDFVATLTKKTPGSRDANSTGGTNPTSVAFPCKGFFDSQATRNLPGSLVEDGTKVIILIGDTIDGGNSASAPASGDQVTLEGTVYIIGEDGVIDRDPVAATYTLKVRPI